MSVLQPVRSCEYDRPIGLADYHKMCPMNFGRYSDIDVLNYRWALLIHTAMVTGLPFPAWKGIDKQDTIT